MSRAQTHNNNDNTESLASQTAPFEPTHFAEAHHDHTDEQQQQQVAEEGEDNTALGRFQNASFPVHEDAVALFKRCPCLARIPTFSKSFAGYGPKCTMALGFSYFMVKGVGDYTLRPATYAMMVDRYGTSAERYQRLNSISTMGWSIKALTAMLCDAFAFLGYTKRWYMFISCVAGGVFALVYGLLPAKESSADIAAAFIFLSSFGKANVDILSEGHYSRLMRQKPEPGSALISVVWNFIMLGSIVASAILGPLSDAKLPHVAVIISGVVQIIPGIIYVFNWYGERVNRVERAEDVIVLREQMKKQRAREEDSERRALAATAEPSTDDSAHAVRRTHDADALNDEFSDNEGAAAGQKPGALVNYEAEVEGDDTETESEAVEPTPCLCGLFEFNKEVATRNWRIFTYSIVMTCAVVAMTCGNILADTLGLLIICVVVSVVCCSMSFWALPLTIAKANVFVYIEKVIYIQIPGALNSFYLASPACLPDGPHFSYTFYNTVASIIGMCAGLAGVSAFHYIFSKRSFRVTYIVTTFARVLAALFDIVMVKRWNIAIGIPDHAMYICGDAVVREAIAMINGMPMVVLLSRMCPRGSESVVYALLAGFANMGGSTSSSLGAIIMEYGWPVVAKPPCDFSNVPWLIFVCCFCTPLLTIPLTLLLPRARICDDIDVDRGMAKRELARLEAQEKKNKG